MPWTLRPTRPLPQRPDPTASPAAQAEPAPDAADVPRCGWFDSSHDLQVGLLVQEHASADVLADVLPLDDWLAMHLQNWRPGAAHRRH